jgi:o-succinylbenzoate---CoA ligase
VFAESVTDAPPVALASVVSTMLRRAIAAGRLGGSRVLVGGGPASVDLLLRAHDAGMLPLQTYGMTEAGSQVCTVAPERFEEELGTAGQPIHGAEVRVEPDGRIAVRGAMVVSCFTDADGWFVTNDLGTLDADGRLVVRGRADAVIVTGGENVHPERVRAVLEGHPGVVATRVFGESDDEWGTRVVAEVVAEGVSADGLRSWAVPRLTPAEVPKEIRIVELIQSKLMEGG